MPSYNDLRPKTDPIRHERPLVFPNLDDEVRRHIIKNLLTLRIDLKQKVSAKRADNNLLVASWNLKEFGHGKQRLPELGVLGATGAPIGQCGKGFPGL